MVANTDFSLRWQRSAKLCLWREETIQAKQLWRRSFNSAASKMAITHREKTTAEGENSPYFMESKSVRCNNSQNAINLWFLVKLNLRSKLEFKPFDPLGK
jgi:hypothetical protein